MLYDVSRGLQVDAYPQFGPMCVVLVSAPVKANYSWFAKDWGPEWRFVPTWTKEEFLAYFEETEDGLRRTRKRRRRPQVDNPNKPNNISVCFSVISKSIVGVSKGVVIVNVLPQ